MKHRRPFEARACFLSHATDMSAPEESPTECLQPKLCGCWHCEVLGGWGNNLLKDASRILKIPAHPTEMSSVHNGT